MMPSLDHVTQRVQGKTISSYLAPRSGVRGVLSWSTPRALKAPRAVGPGPAGVPGVCAGLEIAAAVLLSLDRLEQGFEVALAEAFRSVSFDHLEEHRGPVLHGPGENLQQVAVFVPVGENLQLPKLIDVHPGITDPIAERVV